MILAFHLHIGLGILRRWRNGRFHICIRGWRLDFLNRQRYFSRFALAFGNCHGTLRYSHTGFLFLCDTCIRSLLRLPLSLSLDLLSKT